eukprot:gene11612-34319_t
MVNPSSRGNQLGTWKMATIVPATDDEYLEFYLSNGSNGNDLKEDRPGGGVPSYQAPRAGSFKLVRGQVNDIDGTMTGDSGTPHAFVSCKCFLDYRYWKSNVTLSGSEVYISYLYPPRQVSNIDGTMIGDASAPDAFVSDIDGTMIGDASAPDAFVSSKRFLDYWESNATLSGSLLVYNTGRSMGQFVELMRRCNGQVAVPDMLITAVGTKVWRLNENGGRTAASGFQWEEDMKWASLLDHGWNLNEARSLAAKLVKHYNDGGMMTILDDGSEHQHRMSLCADCSTLGHVTSFLAEGFRKANLENELVHWLSSQPQDGKVVYADASYADGILEGLARHSLY